MSLYDQVALALRRLNSGDSLTSVANYFGTSHITVSHVTWWFVKAVEERGLPNCCGAIDTTHIMMLLAVTDKNLLDRMDNHVQHDLAGYKLVKKELAMYVPLPVPSQAIGAIKRILYVAEDDASIVEEAQAMILKQDAGLSPISEEDLEFDAAANSALSPRIRVSDASDVHSSGSPLMTC
ncbi:hypothetical protein CTI12_AA337820 [Artemisia annua]|uniref:Uncharacterized protein n=1 Tax=Artemisia annua TaxID=35608 RepID=A0A2U1MVL3_ARTAN|nr:hypothetical protein CTI12_AA337820 [Artemisia annua]